MHCEFLIAAEYDKACSSQSRNRGDSTAESSDRARSLFTCQPTFVELAKKVAEWPDPQLSKGTVQFL
jgi:hypothetical protein